MPVLLLLIRHTVSADIFTWNLDLGPVLHVRLILYASKNSHCAVLFLPVMCVSAHSHSIFFHPQKNQSQHLHRRHRRALAASQKTAAAQLSLTPWGPARVPAQLRRNFRVRWASPPCSLTVEYGSEILGHHLTQWWRSRPHVMIRGCRVVYQKASTFHRVWADTEAAATNIRGNDKILDMSEIKENLFFNWLKGLSSRAAAPVTRSCSAASSRLFSGYSSSAWFSAKITSGLLMVSSTTNKHFLRFQCLYV